MPRGYLKKAVVDVGKKVARGGSSGKSHCSAHVGRKNCVMCNTWLRYTKSRLGKFAQKERCVVAAALSDEEVCGTCPVKANAGIDVLAGHSGHKEN